MTLLIQVLCSKFIQLYMNTLTFLSATSLLEALQVESLKELKEATAEEEEGTLWK